MNVLSLFDGISCCQVALNRAGVKYDKYFASEIDKHAIKVTQKNFPDTIQLGSVVDVDTSTLPPIWMVAGGSPCQDFSFSGKRKGMATSDNQEILTLDHYLQLKSDGFEFEGSSYLFWEYMRILKEVKPKYFFLENVMMGEKWERILSKAIGVNPIMINSALLSAQNRKRLYFSNIGLEPAGLFGHMESIIPQPKDKGILLKDILETNVPEKYYLSDKMLNYFNSRKDNYNAGKINYKSGDDKASCINASSSSSSSSIDISDNIILDQQWVVNSNGNLREIEKGMCLDANYHKGMDNHAQRTMIVASRGRNPENPKSRKSGLNTEQQLEPRLDGKTNTLTSVQKDNLVLVDFSHKNEGLRFYKDKAPTLNQRDYKEPRCISDGLKIRRLTEVECERLQTLPDGHTEGISSTQRYRSIGNGWTVDVIAYIFKFIKQ